MPAKVPAYIVVIGLLVLVAVPRIVSASEDPWIGVMSVGDGTGTVSGVVTIREWVKEDAKFEKVEFFANAESIGTATAAPFSLDWDTAKVEDGEYKVQVKGTLADGKVKESKVVVVTVSNG